MAYSMQCSVVQCNKMQCIAIQSNTLQYNAMHYNEMQYKLRTCRTNLGTAQYESIKIQKGCKKERFIHFNSHSDYHHDLFRAGTSVQ